MRSNKGLVLVFVLVGVPMIMTGWSRADPPDVIRYQARLTDEAGVPLAGSRMMTFEIWDAPSGGLMLWREGPRSLAIAAGDVDVLLGEVTPLDSLLLTGSNRFLSVTVDGTVLGPRQRLASVPFALAAARVGSKAEADLDRLLPPVGAILPYLGHPVSLPPNWLLCDGTTVIDPESPLNGATLPDMRGRFPRGEIDSARDILASGAVTGGSDDVAGHSHTESTTGSHTHSFSASHTHPLSGRTGKITDSGPDPGLTPYHMRDDNAGWEGNCRVGVGSCGDNNWEGHHYHTLDTAGTAAAATASGTTGSAGSHSHTITSGGASAGGNIPRYAALHFIIRIK